MAVKFLVIWKNIERGNKFQPLNVKKSFPLRCHRTESIWLVGGLDTTVPSKGSVLRSCDLDETSCSLNVLH